MALNQVRLGIIVAIYEICSRPSCAVVRIAETCVMSLMILKSHIFTFINLTFLLTMLFLTKTFESLTSLWNCSTELKMSPQKKFSPFLFSLLLFPSLSLFIHICDLLMLLLYELCVSFTQNVTRHVVKYSPVPNCRGGLNFIFEHIHGLFHFIT